jgi:predicted amidohydrolase YtcJ
MYDWAILSPLAYQYLGIQSIQDLPTGAKFELDANQQRTGAMRWAASYPCLTSLPKPNFDQKLAGTRKFFHELNRLGITGFIDPGGFNMYPTEYSAHI